MPSRPPYLAIFAAVTAVSAAILGSLAVAWPLILLAVLGLFAAYGFVTGRSHPPQPVEEQPDSSEQAFPVGFGQTLLRQMPAALIVISSSGRTTYANPAALELLPNYTEGVHFSALIRAPAFIDAITEVTLDGRDRTFTFTTVQGRERYFEAQATRLPDGSDLGPDAQIIVQITDRSRDRIAAQSRSDFIANASHELRTPLASILGYVETLQGHARDDPEAQARFLKIMQSQAERMQRLVDDLMSLSRIEMNVHVRPVEIIDLNKIGLEVTSALLPLARNEKIALVCDIPADAEPQSVRGDHDQLCQVFTNIIDNALRYCNEGQEVHVTIAEPSPLHPGQVGIRVTDTGPGIPREHLHRLTERFYRVNVNTSRARGGTGLGLAIVKHILNRHGGALDVDSRLGEGSAFTVWLPKVKNDDSRQEMTQQMPQNGK